MPQVLTAIRSPASPPSMLMYRSDPCRFSSCLVASHWNGVSGPANGLPSSLLSVLGAIQQSSELSVLANPPNEFLQAFRIPECAQFQD